MKWPRRSAVALVFAATLLTATSGSASDDPGVVQFVVLLGQSGVISGGPVRDFLCDDGGLVKLEFTDAGVALRGMRVGTTLCSFRNPASVRQVMRVVVKAPPGASPAPQGVPSSGYGG
jgi:hypothetical protein